jgi:hypothetical protein
MLQSHEMSPGTPSLWQKCPPVALQGFKSQVSGSRFRVVPDFVFARQRVAQDFEFVIANCELKAGKAS